MNGIRVLKRPLCIAISGKSGCGNTSISSMIAEALGIDFINFTFRSLAKERGMDFETLCRLAEDDPSWDTIVDERQKELARLSSCVVGSRLAIWMLDNADAKFYLYADERERAARIQLREGGTLEERLAHTSQRDARDAARYQSLYNLDISLYAQVEGAVVIDTNRKSKIDVAEEILQNLEARGLIAR